MKTFIFLLICTGLTQAQPISFSAESVLNNNKNSRAIISDDFNSDNKPDLAALVLDNYEGDRVAVFINQGNGVYNIVPDAMYMVGDYGFDLAAGDLNNDDYPDLVTASNDDSTLVIWYGNIDGSFDNNSSIAAPINCKHVAIADLNNDNNMDIAVVENTHLAIYFGNGNGSFQTPNIYDSSFNPWDVNVADMNNDGFNDILVGYGGGSSFFIHYNDTKGDFSNKITFNTIQPPWYLSVDDFNSDGHKDLVVGSGSWDSDNVTVLLNDWNGNFTDAGTFSPGSYIRDLATGDINNDSNSDILIIDRHGLYGIPGTGTGDFLDIDTIAFDPGNYNAEDVCIEDINGDAKLDLIVGKAGGISIYYNTGSTTSVSETMNNNSLKLNQNYPNPFNSTTTICFDVVQSNHVSLNIFNLLGEEISILSEEWLDQNQYCKSFDGSNLSPGIYFYQLKSENYKELRKMILLK